MKFKLTNLSKTQKYVLFGVPVAVGLYFIIRQFMGKKTYNDALQQQQGGGDNGGGNTGGGNTGGGNTGGGNTGGGNTGGGNVPSMEVSVYKVTTLVSNLNVREQPSTSSRIVASLAKGTLIRARASSTSGWFEAFPQTGSNQRLGYVSADYITLVQ